MRVIAGEFRSRKLKTSEGLETRPTPDRLRESLFSILQAEIEGITFLDAYAGSGAVGIEALSRGASRAIFVERSRSAAEVLKENISTLRLESRSEIFTGKVLQILKKKSADIIFLDPPYELESEYLSVLGLLGENPPSLVIVQHSKRFDPGDQHGKLIRDRIVRQGENALSFYRLP